MMSSEQAKSATTAAGPAGDEPDKKDRLDKASEQLEKISTLLATLGPAGEDALTGAVILQDKAGTLGGWLAHRQVATAADFIASEVLGILEEPARVLIVDSRDVLGEDVDAGRARTWMTSTDLRLTRLVKEVELIRTTFTSGIATPVPGTDKFDPRVTKRRDPRAAQRPKAASEEETPADTPDEKEPEVAPAAGGVAGALLGFLALAREDYDLAPVEVVSGSTELSTLVAGYLSRRASKPEPVDVTVEVDSFRGSGASLTLNSYGALTTSLHQLADALDALASAVTPVEARRDALQTRGNALEEQWAKAVVAKETPDGAAGELLDRMTTLALEQQHLDTQLAPVGALVAGRVALLQEVRDRMTELTTAPAGGGLSPLGEAIRSERMSPAQGEASPITHILYVHVDALGGDKVTRKTWLGEPGRMGFLGSFNGSWLLAQTNGTITGGGAADGSTRLTYDLGTGQASLQPIADTGEITRTPRDELAAWTPVLVVIVLVVVGVAALLFAVAPILEVLLRGG